MKISIEQFMEQLASKSPIPGGGGASALMGAIGVSLCSMVANLTLGKLDDRELEADMEEIQLRTKKVIGLLLEYITKDAEAFLPLSAAYSIPKNQPDREEVLEKALIDACKVPLEIVRELTRMIPFVEKLEVKGLKLTMSDVAIAASAIRSAMEGAITTIYINTKLLKDKTYALQINLEANQLLAGSVKRCEAIYQRIREKLLEE